MWKVVAELQRNLDEAAGIKKSPEGLEESNASHVSAANDLTEARKTGSTEEALRAEGKQLATELGREKDRNRQLMAEKKGLEAKVEDALQRLAGFYSKESQWEEHRRELENNTRALAEQCRQLQSTAERQENEICSATGEAQSTRSDLSSVQQKLLQTEHLYQKKIEELVREKEELTRRAARNLEEARSSAESELVRAEGRIARLEQELSNAIARASAAESKNFEIARNDGELMQELRLQLQAAEKQAVALSEKLAGQLKRGRDLEAEVASMQQVVRSEQQKESDELLVAEQRLMEAEGRINTLRDEMDRLNQKLVKAAAENSELRTRILAYQDQIHQTQHVAVPHAASIEIACEKERSVEKKEVPPASEAAEAPTVPSSARLQKELLRFAAEVTECRESMPQYDALKRRFSQLLEQHDLLLQMYGQIEERNCELQEELETARASFRDQIAVLANEVQRLSHSGQ